MPARRRRCRKIDVPDFDLVVQVQGEALGISRPRQTSSHPAPELFLQCISADARRHTPDVLSDDSRPEKRVNVRRIAAAHRGDCRLADLVETWSGFAAYVGRRDGQPVGFNRVSERCGKAAQPKMLSKRDQRFEGVTVGRTRRRAR